MKDVELYKELVSFCNNNKDRIEKSLIEKLNLQNLMKDVFKKCILKSKKNQIPSP